MNFYQRFSLIFYIGERLCVRKLCRIGLLLQRCRTVFVDVCDDTEIVLIGGTRFFKRKPVGTGAYGVRCLFRDREDVVSCGKAADQNKFLTLGLTFAVKACRIAVADTDNGAAFNGK